VRYLAGIDIYSRPDWRPSISTRPDFLERIGGTLGSEMRKAYDKSRPTGGYQSLLKYVLPQNKTEETEESRKAREALEEKEAETKERNRAWDRDIEIADWGRKHFEEERKKAVCCYCQKVGEHICYEAIRLDNKHSQA
jgi:hypothetical protein